MEVVGKIQQASDVALKFGNGGGEPFGAMANAENRQPYTRHFPNGLLCLTQDALG